MAAPRYDDLPDLAPDHLPTEVSEMEWQALSRAQWGALRANVQQQHLDNDLVRSFLTHFAEEVDKATPPDRGTYRDFYTTFGAVVKDGGTSGRPHYVFRDRRKALTDWSTHKPVSVQTCAALQFWFAGLIDGAELEKPSPSTIDRALTIFKRQKDRIPEDRLVGKPGEAVWITPVRSMDEIITKKPDITRDLLGLFRNQMGQHALVAVLAEDVGGLKPADIATEARAPTAFDARGYERFRHWPLDASAPEATAGRTYDLDRSRRASGAVHGRPELVHAPQKLIDCVELRYDGQYSSVAPATLSDHQAFANDVAGNSSLREIVAEVVSLV